MKTNEFIRIANELGYGASLNRELVVVQDLNTLSTVLLVSNETELSIDTHFDHSGLDKSKLESLILSAVELARTAIEDRGEPKKYRYKLPFRLAVTEIEKDAHLRKDRGFIVIDSAGVDFAKIDSDFHFTDKEVENYTGKARALFKACNKELVE